jgi:hypothetical protein
MVDERFHAIDTSEAFERVFNSINETKNVRRMNLDAHYCISCMCFNIIMNYYDFIIWLVKVELVSLEWINRISMFTILNELIYNHVRIAAVLAQVLSATLLAFLILFNFNL